MCTFVHRCGLEPHVVAARVMPKTIVVLTDLVFETGDQRRHVMSGRRSSVQGLRPIERSQLLDYPDGARL